MGRKTYESIGRLLPGRRNIIISRNTGYKIDGADSFTSVDAALEICHDEKIFIIGGGEIFRQTLPKVRELYRTLIQHKFEADAFFPEIKSDEFELTWQECHEKDEKNAYDYCFQKWERKGKLKIKN
jgi:dihydrofolate reductase